MSRNIKGPEFDMFFVLPKSVATQLAKLRKSKRKDPIKVKKTGKQKRRG